MRNHSPTPLLPRRPGGQQPLMKRMGSVVLAIVALATSHVQANAQDLSTAASFAVLGGQSVTNTGPTIVNGDLGVWPGTAISGFSPGTVNGAIHQGNTVAMQAQSDVTTAYNTLAGLPPDATIPGAPAELGGLTLLPGVYEVRRWRS